MITIRKSVAKNPGNNIFMIRKYSIVFGNIRLFFFARSAESRCPLKTDTFELSMKFTTFDCFKKSTCNYGSENSNSILTI